MPGKVLCLKTLRDWSCLTEMKWKTMALRMKCTDDEEINTDQDVEALSGDSPMEVVSSWPFNE